MSSSHRWASAVRRRSGYTHLARLLPFLRPTSTPATTWLGSALRATTPWNVSPRKLLRRRGEFPLPRVCRTRLTRRAGQVWWSLLSAKRSTSTVGVFTTACGFRLELWHGIGRATLITLTLRGCTLSRLSCTTVFTSARFAVLFPAK